MTKPLCIVLQLAGAVLVILNLGHIVNSGINTAFVFGILLIIGGGIGTRLNRNKEKA